MKTTQVIHIDKKELVENFNQKILDLAKEISYLYSEDENTLTIYDKYSFNPAFASLKRRERAFYIGKASMLLSMIEAFNVYISKQAFQFVSYLAEQEYL